MNFNLRPAVEADASAIRTLVWRAGINPTGLKWPRFIVATHPGELHLMCLSSQVPLYEKFGFRAITEDEMPPYFRRIKRLTKIAEFVMSEGECLLVMCKG